MTGGLAQAQQRLQGRQHRAAGLELLHHVLADGGPDAFVELSFVLRELGVEHDVGPRRQLLEPGKTTIYDVNHDPFVVHGLSYGDENLIEILKTLSASFDPRQLRKVSSDDKATREYPVSRAWAWGAERSG